MPYSSHLRRSEKLPLRRKVPMPWLPTAIYLLRTPIERKEHKQPRRRNHYTTVRPTNLQTSHGISFHPEPYIPKLDGCEKQTDMLLDLKVSKQRYGIKPQTIRNCAIPHAVVGKNEKLAARYTAPMPRLRTATDPFWTPIERQAHKLPRRNNHYT